MEKRPWIVAHRGYHREGIPENTLAAFLRARALGLNMVELDIRVSADRKLVVIHDETLDRTTGKKGKVELFTLHELREFAVQAEEGARTDSGGVVDPSTVTTPPERIPSLDEVVEALSGFPVLIDFNDHRVVEPLCDFLKAHPEENLHACSPLHPSLEAIRRACPDIPIWVTLNGQNLPKDPIGYARAFSFQALNFQYSLLLANPKFVQTAKESLEVSCWTPNKKEEMLELIRLGIDAIITDEPLLLREMLK
jgi:glycerophosphoryl diester phosphodiesterase